MSTEFSVEERDAMKERARELKASAKGEAKASADLADLQSKIAEMTPADRDLAERVHAIVTEAAPSLSPKTWYGQPAYALNGKVVVFFQAAGKFKTRYATLGFSEDAQLDDGGMWPTSYALASVSAADEKVIRALVMRAVGGA